jgi:hypothetical protein
MAWDCFANARIVLTLRALCFSTTERCAGHFLTVGTIVSQLLYRREREVGLAQRSALRKIMEQDDSAARFMVLVVVEVPAEPGETFKLLLSDGWYTVGAALDTHLCALVRQGKIRTGYKLCVWGAQLEAPGPTTPLEAGMFS